MSFQEHMRASPMWLLDYSLLVKAHYKVKSKLVENW